MQVSEKDEDILSLYQKIILDHGKSPRNAGVVKQHNCRSEGKNPLCGDRVTVTAALGDEGQVLNLKFDGKGCAISIASASMMTEAVRGLRADDVRKMIQAVAKLCKEDTSDDQFFSEYGDGLGTRIEYLSALSGVRQFPARFKCANLPWQTLLSCLDGNDSATTEG
ncbi:MAG: SUF system NifU family Fe-S cluster assembly protein [Rhodospirillaceae bacterium]|nr:SUF system NifU family Fe-S cluster assembly protein [Rhodospirillaceae bacterium]